MFGRFTEISAFDVLAGRFDIEVIDAGSRELSGRYNIAPSQLVPIVIAPDGRRRLLPARWGLRPLWARHGKIAPVSIRAEAVPATRTFREILRFSRCLVPADGFFEWRTVPGQKRKQAYYLRLKGGGLFAFAGIYTPPQPEEDTCATCAIITTVANEVMAPMHGRMPAILDPADERRWLNPFFVSAADVLPCLRPLPAERMEAFPVSPLVSSPRNEGAHLLERVTVEVA
jgi:putative SOS response-associated peptidase YedK